MCFKEGATIRGIQYIIHREGKLGMTSHKPKGLK